MSEMVERAAKAAEESLRAYAYELNEIGHSPQHAAEVVRDVLQALSEPTDEMVEAGARAIRDHCGEPGESAVSFVPAARAVFSAMVAHLTAASPRS